MTDPQNSSAEGFSLAINEASQAFQTDLAAIERILSAIASNEVFVETAKQGLHGLEAGDTEAAMTAIENAYSRLPQVIANALQSKKLAITTAIEADSSAS